MCKYICYLNQNNCPIKMFFFLDKLHQLICARNCPVFIQGGPLNGPLELLPKDWRPTFRGVHASQQHEACLRPPENPGIMVLMGLSSESVHFGPPLCR